MKKSWDAYINQRLKDAKVREAFIREKKGLELGLALAKERQRRGMTQYQVARRIGTSTPQVSRTENKPESTNVKTLMRYAEALGMSLDVRLVPKHTTARKKEARAAHASA